MSTRRKRSITSHIRGFKLWALFFAAFAIVGGSACYFAYQGALERHRSSLREELENLAKLGSLQVDATEHERLRRPDDMSTLSYAQQISRLARVQDQIGTIRYIYTIRAIDGKLFFVLDPTPPGDHDKDGIDDKSYLMEPYESETQPVYEVLRTGRAVTTGQLQTDKWGTFLSGYAPVKDSEGHTVAVLGVDMEASQVAALQNRLTFVFVAAFLFVLTLGAIVSYFLAAHVARWSGNADAETLERIGQVGGRTTILQIGLAAAVITCFGLGLYGKAVSTREKQEYLKASANIEQLLRVQFEIDGALQAKHATPDRLEGVLAGLSGPEWAQLHQRTELASHLLASGKPEWRTVLGNVADETRNRIVALHGNLAEIGAVMTDRQETFNLLFIVAALLTLGSLVLVRAATVQQEQLAKAAFEASQLHEELGIKNSEIEAKNSVLSSTLANMQDNFEAMVQAWVKAVEAKDLYTAGHSERVMQYSIAIGRKMGLSQHELHILQMGALIHDIGKIGVPDDVLTKPDRLTPEEFEIVKSHPDVGYRMISNIPLFRECAPIVLWHHEKLDGSGYPDGLRGDEIPLLVRISTVADMFDAMTSTRAYRSSLGPDVALEILRQDASKGALEPKIVEILAEIVNEQGVLWHPPIEEAA